ncbi:PTS system, fructose-specific IIA component [Pilibacter termitis]|uniref:PTS system, fructose-specific IIA component n=1 Tax=Pilibacter termitis TaxID=263852 RepID=A0A1T4K0J2_9ENTE|nr:PTS sugar transporter subunit IIA [Pilibacter termitis]SJZ35996.1 PTS system, fructose-specific IIA component [Pilibacter termitis]
MKIIEENLVDFAITANTKEEVVKQLAKKMADEGRLYCRCGYIESVLERENLTSTGIGFGIAIPHGKSEHVKEVSIAFGRLSSPMDWQSLDNQPVEMIILLAVPEKNQGDQHLRMLAGLSRKLIHEEFRKKLQFSTDKEEIVQLLNESMETITMK